MKKNITILLVDDDEDDRTLFIESVKEVDNTIRCVTAGDGLEALNLLKNADYTLPDFIFLDLRMPRFSGRKCLEEIRKDARLSAIPVFIYTTSREVQDSNELRKLGAVHFISKPTDPNEIYYILSCVLNEKWDQVAAKDSSIS